MKPDYQLNSKIKVVSKSSPYYRWRGTVIADPDEGCGLVKCRVKEPVEDGRIAEFLFSFSEVECIQKKFVDIERLVQKDEEIAPGVVKKANCFAFDKGDIIQISEKIDGANASVCYNPDEGKLEVFSRTNLLGIGGLRGFYDYCMTKFGSSWLADSPNLVVFGEWLVPHNAIYDVSAYSKWYVYDIWDKVEKNYKPQSFVKEFCKKWGLIYINVLYEGPFISWDHCREFCRKCTYGKDQEGVVVKNQTKLSDSSIRWPKVIKIVNEEFIETKHTKKELRPETIAARKAEDEAIALMEQVLTRNRVAKLIKKCVDEDQLPAELKCSDIPKILKILPKLAYEDLMKEEPETMQAAAEKAGKACSKLVVKHVRDIVLGA